jgi:hypothetical protein
MKPAESMNILYAKLCQELGDLSFKQRQINSEIKKILKKIKKLNELHPDLVKHLSNGAANERKPNVNPPSPGVSNDQGGLDWQTPFDQG